VVRAAVGPEVEDIVYRFHLHRVRPAADAGYSERLERLAQTDMQVLLLDLADVAEKHVDLGVLYYGDGAWMQDATHRHGEFLVAFARRIGQSALATVIEDGLAQVAADPGLSPALRAPKERKYRSLVVPQSCRRRLWPFVAEGCVWLSRPSGWARTFQRLSGRLTAMAGGRQLS
jgi:hypothetical protein